MTNLRLPLASALAATVAGSLVASAVVAVGTAHAATTLVDRVPVRTFTLAAGDITDLAVAPSGEVYVALGGDRVEVYAADATGVGVTPVRVIEGPGTGLAGVDDIALDAEGRLYALSSGTPSVTVHDPAADGNSAPLRTIAGPQTKIVDPSGVAVAADGRVYVTDTYVAGEVGPSLLAFAPGADGNQAPDRVVTGGSTSLGGPQDVAVGSDGDVYVGEHYQGVLVFDGDATGDVAPARRLARAGGMQALSLAIDSSDHVYAASTAGGRVVGFHGGVGTDEPMVELAGPASGIQAPVALALDADRRMYVAEDDGPTVRVFDPVVPFAVPSAPRSVTVSGAPSAGTRTVGWSAPERHGGKPVTGYEVTVRNGSITLLRRTTAASVTSVVLSRRALRAGRLAVSVVARNAVGVSAAGSASFSVAAAKPGRVRGLKVKGRAGAAKRRVVWKAPAWDGGAKVTGYRVVVKQGSVRLARKTLPAGKRRLVLRTGAFPLGKSVVTVRAKSSAGWGPRARRTFRVAL